MKTSYLYKWFSSSEYIGTLDNVISDFELYEEINSNGSQIEIELGISLQNADASFSYDYLVTEDGTFIITDLNENIIVDNAVEVAGFPSLNDKIEVWEYSDYYPNGVIKYTGLVSKWRSNYINNTTKITVISYGVQLDNYLVQVLPNTVVASNDEVVNFSSIDLWSGSKAFPESITVVGQTFTVPASVDLYSVEINLLNGSISSQPVEVQIVQGTPLLPGESLATVARLIPAGPESSLYSFVFTSVVNLVATETYHIKITTDGVDVVVLYDNDGLYADGAMYTYSALDGWLATSDDLNFIVTTLSGGVGNEFNSQDPSAIVRSLFDSFNSLGGVVTYTDDSVEDTGTEVSYTFKFSKYNEAYSKCVELAPANWWKFIDSSTNTAYFKPLSQEIDHTFVLGEHISNLDIEYSLENVKNIAYLSGGEVSGTNIVESYSDSLSIEKYGTWLETKSDNRVTLDSTALLLAESLVNQNNNPRFNTSVSIPFNKYDHHSVRIGDIVSFSNTNSLIDNLRLQVMSKRHNKNVTTYQLDILPPSTTKRVEDLKRNLEKLQTVNNPAD